MKNFCKNLTKHKGLFIFGTIISILLTFGTAYLIYSISLLTGIENVIRLIARIAIGIIWFIILIFLIKNTICNKKAKFIILAILTLLYSSVLIFISFNIHKAYSAIDNMSNDYTLYSTSIVSLKDDKAESISDIGNKDIGILDDKTSVDGYQIPQEIIKKNKLKNELKKYESYVDLLDALYKKEIDYVFLPTNYSILFKNLENYDTLDTKTKIIYTQEKKIKKETSKNTSTKLDKPFTILLMGVDSEVENIAGSSFNGDSLMLITFNPNTLSSTILSIPRDTYVPITCFAGQKKNKITHAAWYGQDCMIDTIENFTDINIDYYMKINFKGAVKLVDALGGISVDVPYSFCEQDSNRAWEENTVYVKEGTQTLNGEQALALARNRHPNPQYCSSKWTNYNSNDFIRGQNQQLIVKAMLEKLKTVKNLDTVYSILDTISNSMETNMSTQQILSFYNIGKDIISKSKNTPISDLLSMQRLYISGKDAYIYDSGSGLTLYDYVPYQGSIDDVVKAMKINLELEEEKVTKKFNFSINEPYEETVIGKGTYTSSTVSLLADLSGYTKTEAQAYARKVGITLSFKTVESNNSSYKDGQVIKQSYPEGTDISTVKTLVLTIVEKKESTSSETTNTTNTNSNVNTNTNTTNTNSNVNTNTNTNTNTANTNTNTNPNTTNEE